MSKIPGYIEKQLSVPPPNPPGRHEALMKLSLQLIGEKIPFEEAFRILREWCPDADKTDKEIRDLLRGAYAKNPQPAVGRNGNGTFYPNLKYQRQAEQPKVKPFQANG